MNQEKFLPEKEQDMHPETAEMSVLARKIADRALERVRNDLTADPTPFIDGAMRLSGKNPREDSTLREMVSDIVADYGRKHYQTTVMVRKADEAAERAVRVGKHGQRYDGANAWQPERDD